MATVLFQMYLSDLEFEKVFQLSRVAFYRLPEWKRNDLKRRVDLFWGLDTHVSSCPFRYSAIPPSFSLSAFTDQPCLLSSSHSFAQGHFGKSLPPAPSSFSSVMEDLEPLMLRWSIHTSLPATTLSATTMCFSDLTHESRAFDWQLWRSFKWAHSRTHFHQRFLPLHSPMCWSQVFSLSIPFCLPWFFLIIYIRHSSEAIQDETMRSMGNITLSGY